MWWTVVHKDFRLLRPHWLRHLAVAAVLGALAVWWGSMSEGGLAGGALLLGAVSLSALIAVPEYAARGVAREWRRSGGAWLNLRVSGAVLLASKILVATVDALGIWVVVSGLWLWMVAADVAKWLPLAIPTHALSGEVSEREIHVLIALTPQFLALGGAGVVLVGVWIAIWVLGFTLARRSVRYRWGPAAWLLAFAVAAVPLWALPQLSGKLQLSHQLGVRIATAGVIPALSLHPLTLFVAPMLLDLVFAVLAFVGESLVLDRAAEV